MDRYAVEFEDGYVQLIEAAGPLDAALQVSKQRDRETGRYTRIKRSRPPLSITAGDE